MLSAAIALTSGLYSLISATGGNGMMGSNSGLLMTVLGIGLEVELISIY